MIHFMCIHKKWKQRDKFYGALLSMEPHYWIVDFY